MEEHKFSNSNLDFNELFDKYKKLNTTYSDIDDFKINIYENCNLLQDLTTVTTGTAFTVPSTNIRLSSFKNNYIIADTQTLDLNIFYEDNESFFTTVENGTYFNNIDLTTIIKTHFNYANDDIYPSKKIIITINLLNEIVDTDGSGALQIDMKEIKEHFHSLFDTLELDINQYATGKHGELEDTNRAPPSSVRGGSGQNAILDSAGPAINITNNNPSYFKLNIKTNGKVSGGFGASGGRGGNGKINETEYTLINTTGQDDEYFDLSTFKFVRVLNVLQANTSFELYWQHITAYYWNGFQREIDTGSTLIGDYITNNFPPTVSPATYLEDEVQSSYDDTANKYTKNTSQYVAGTLHPDHNKLEASNTENRTVITRYYIKKLEYTYTKTGAISPTVGETGSKADYSKNAGDTFDTQNGDTGTANNGQGGAGGTKGNPGGITNITATNISIT